MQYIKKDLESFWAPILYLSAVKLGKFSNFSEQQYPL